MVLEVTEQQEHPAKYLEVKRRNTGTLRLSSKYFRSKEPASDVPGIQYRTLQGLAAVSRLRSKGKVGDDFIFPARADQKAPAARSVRSTQAGLVKPVVRSVVNFDFFDLSFC